MSATAELADRITMGVLPNPFEVAFVFNGLPEDKFQSSISISITQNMMLIWSTHFYIEVPFLH